jgi:hypothetical protein
MSMKVSFYFAFSVVLLLSFVNAQTDSGKARFEFPDGIIVRPHAYAHMESGQIVHGNLKYDDIQTNGNQYGIDHVWTEDSYVSLGFEVLDGEHLKLVFGIDTKLYFSYPQFLDHDRYTKNIRQDVAMDDVYAQYGFDVGGRAALLGQVGYFKYKYNPDVRNCGEYLFRSGTYPAFVVNSFDFAEARLLGFHAGSDLFKTLKLDAFLVSATVFPSMNWSLAGIADYDVGRMHLIDVGAGIELANLIDIYTGHSFPVFGGDPTQVNSDKFPQYIESIRTVNDTTKDTTLKNYTFRGTKVMGRISLDPKALFPHTIFGENDLKIYAEACIIGTKSYPDSGFISGHVYTLVAPSYNKIWEKMPFVLGINLPAFKVLDVLNFEVEYFSAKYYNDASDLINKGSQPLPYNVFDYYNNPQAPRKSDIKWSAYAKRSFHNGRFSIVGQVARDHMRLPCAQYDLEYWNDLLVTKDDWWWALKTSWGF